MEGGRKEERKLILNVLKCEGEHFAKWYDCTDPKLEFERTRFQSQITFPNLRFLLSAFILGLPAFLPSQGMCSHLDSSHQQAYRPGITVHECESRAHNLWGREQPIHQLRTHQPRLPHPQHTPWASPQVLGCRPHSNPDNSQERSVPQGVSLFKGTVVSKQETRLVRSMDWPDMCWLTHSLFFLGLQAGSHG